MELFRKTLGGLKASYYIRHLLKVLYLVINQEVNYGISNFNDYCSKHYRTET